MICHVHCRGASVQAVSKLTCLALKRDRFTEVLGKHHLEEIMAREKSAAVVTTRLMRLQVGMLPCTHACPSLVNCILKLADDQAYGDICTCLC